jgi:hypothetical protein
MIGETTKHGEVTYILRRNLGATFCTITTFTKNKVPE